MCNGIVCVKGVFLVLYPNQYLSYAILAKDGIPASIVLKTKIYSVLIVICLGYLISLLDVLWADLEWKLTYVGSAEDEKYDQVLESVLVGPVNVGNYRFVFQACFYVVMNSVPSIA